MCQKKKIYSCFSYGLFTYYLKSIFAWLVFFLLNFFKYRKLHHQIIRIVKHIFINFFLFCDQLNGYCDQPNGYYYFFSFTLLLLDNNLHAFKVFYYYKFYWFKHFPLNYFFNLILEILKLCFPSEFIQFSYELLRYRFFLDSFSQKINYIDILFIFKKIRVI